MNQKQRNHTAPAFQGVKRGVQKNTQRFLIWEIGKFQPVEIPSGFFTRVDDHHAGNDARAKLSLKNFSGMVILGGGSYTDIVHIAMVPTLFDGGELKDRHRSGPQELTI